MSGDANHVTSGRPDGEGALLAIRGAFRNILNGEKSSSEYRNQFWFVNAHATSTPLGDSAELTAIQKFLREIKESEICDVIGTSKDGTIRVTSHKGNMGHLVTTLINQHFFLD